MFILICVLIAAVILLTGGLRLTARVLVAGLLGVLVLLAAVYALGLWQYPVV
ncbi:hypothetical protein [Pararhodobacter sp.]|uniref:hypothetical protein n=1 Tax=Pararhodobacter sp. TaxID=2127056 RepID=UPI002B0027E0|nr:hypothetical protein [Pararhodobacter sp.]